MFSIRTVLPSAGSAWVQIAHAGGGLPLKGDNHLQVLGAFAAHISRDDSATRHVLFDLSFVPAPEESVETAQALGRLIRTIGIRRFLFASDYNVVTLERQIAMLNRLGLTAEEMQILRDNCAPWAC